MFELHFEKWADFWWRKGQVRQRKQYEQKIRNKKIEAISGKW